MKDMSLLTSRWLVALVVVSLPACQSTVEDSLLYLGQVPPSLKAEIFAPGLVSVNDRHEFGSAFSADGTEFFFGVDTGDKAEIRFSRLEGKTWTKARTILSHEIYSFNDQFLSPDENELFFISNQPLDGEGDQKDHDLWFSVRRGDGWGAPENAGPVINSDREDYYISFTKEGTLFFASNRAAEEGRNFDFDVYAAPRVDGEFQEPRRLGNSINSRGYEGDVFVAPDESYLIFAAARREGLGKGDLYVSFRMASGEWTKARNMGPDINTEGHELCPFVTRDGRYFFYTSNQDIYWVDAAILDIYR